MLGVELADINIKNWEGKVQVKKRKKTFTERYYHEIPVDHYGLIKYPGRFGTTKKVSNDDDYDCGSLKAIYSCTCGCTRKAFPYSCNNINCPECYINSILETCDRETDRFSHILQLLYDKGFRKPYLRHVVYSPPKNENALHNSYEYNKAWNKVKNIVKEFNWSGMVIFHPYRRARDEFDNLIVPHVLVYSPHWHIIGHGWIPQWFGKRYDAIFESIRVIYNQKQLYNTIKYLLTHAGYYPDKHITRWFGQYSYNKLTKKNCHKIIEPVKSQCDDYIYNIDLYDLEWSENDGLIEFSSDWYNYLDLEKYLKEIEIKYDFAYNQLSSIWKYEWNKGKRRKKKKNI